MYESLHATLECEFVERTRLRSPNEAQFAVSRLIEGWYNPTRRHSSLGYLWPIDCQRERAERQSSQPVTVH